MLGRDSATEPWLEFGGWSSAEEHLLARRMAGFHRRHRRAAIREWMLALPVVVVSMWLTVLAVAVFVH
jgi:hypothetical protein